MSRMKKESFGRKLFALVMPMAVQNLFGSLVSASDALMLGFLDQMSLSAVSLAGQISFVMSLFYMAFIIGATVLAAQYWGKGDIPANSIAAGNPCKVIREIDDRDDCIYYRDRPIDPEDLAEEARLRNG